MWRDWPPAAAETTVVHLATFFCPHCCLRCLILLSFSGLVVIPMARNQVRRASKFKTIAVTRTQPATSNRKGTLVALCSVYLACV